MPKPSAIRVASIRLLVDMTMVFLDALRRRLPKNKRSFIEVVPSALDTLAGGTMEVLAWRINVALHTPATVGKIVGRVMQASKPNGPLREILEKVIEGESIDKGDVLSITKVVENATVDVLNDIADVSSAAASLRLPVDDAIRLTIAPKLRFARKAVEDAFVN